MNASANPVLVGGEEVAPGEVALTLETGGGAAESAPDALPCGDYLVREVESPEGYLGTDAEVPFWIGNTYLDDSGRDSPAFLNSTGDM